MKIVIATPLYPPEVGGPATYTALLERELSLRGFDVCVAKWSDILEWPFGIKHILFFFKLFRMSASANIIFAQDPLGVGFPALCAAKILGKKFVVKTVGDRAWEEYMNQGNSFVYPEDFYNITVSFGVRLRQFAQKYVAWHADHIIVPSEYLKKIVTNFGVMPEKIKVIYNAFELPKVNITHDEARAKFLLSGEVMVSIGRLVSWKGFETLIEMFPEIVKRNPNAKLYIIGDGPEKGNLQKAINMAGLPKNVFLKGPLSHEETLAYLVAADIMVLNTGYEGLSHVILEAMSVGVPIITTNVGGNTELIEDGVSGRLVSYQDKKALEETITEILADVLAARERFEKPAREKAAEFSKEKMLDSLIQFFKQL